MYSLIHFENDMNRLSEKGEPFFFIIDFECKKPYLKVLKEIDPNFLLYDLRGNTNLSQQKQPSLVPEIKVENAIPYTEYVDAIRYVQKRQYEGDSWLLNVTFPTEVSLNISLKELFPLTQSLYKLYFKTKYEEFILFSPETFVRVEADTISSYPMKGTIDASVKNAKQKILKDEKEAAEHLTITDLIRNDLNRVCEDVKVNRYRYIDTICSKGKKLHQVSSEIMGTLSSQYRNRLGSLMLSLLPAGSISGAPKKETISIIKKIENGERGYYTGVFGLFDGKVLDSAVMIRYIEKKDNRLFFRSGGGITIYSNIESEYQELLDKIYVPTG